MSFKGQSVWVRVGDDGRPVLDGDGRAEMKYRESDTRSYRPAPGNLAPDGGGAPAPERAARSARPAPTGASRPRERGEQPSPAPSGETVHIWTDGACSGNPGPMGIGIVVIAGDRRKELGEYLGRGTNNIAELTAVRRGLELAADVAPVRERPVRLYTDSSYAIGLLSQGWKAKANQALIAELRDFLRPYRGLRFVKVEGHAGVRENERCDLLARQAIARNRGL